MSATRPNATLSVPVPLGPMETEALRRFRHLTVRPLANLSGAELTRVLERRARGAVLPITPSASRFSCGPKSPAGTTGPGRGFEGGAQRPLASPLCSTRGMLAHGIQRMSGASFRFL